MRHKSSFKVSSLILIFLILNVSTESALEAQDSRRQLLADVIELDIPHIACTRGHQYFEDTRYSIQQWISILESKDSLDGDLAVLQIVKGLITRAETDIQNIDGHSQLFIQLKNTKNQIFHTMKSLVFSQVNSDWADAQIEKIMEYVEVLNKAKTQNDKLQLVSTIQTAIAELINDINNVQCQIQKIGEVDIEALRAKLPELETRFMECEANEEQKQEEVHEHEATEVGGDATEVGGDATEVRGDATEVGGDATEVGGDATEVGGDASEVGGDATEVGGDASEVGGDATEVGGDATEGTAEEDHISGEGQVETGVLINEEADDGTAQVDIGEDIVSEIEDQASEESSSVAPSSENLASEVPVGSGAPEDSEEQTFFGASSGASIGTSSGPLEESEDFISGVIFDDESEEGITSSSSPSTSEGVSEDQEKRLNDIEEQLDDLLDQSVVAGGQAQAQCCNQGGGLVVVIVEDEGESNAEPTDRKRPPQQGRDSSEGSSGVSIGGEDSDAGSSIGAASEEAGLSVGPSEEGASVASEEGDIFISDLLSSEESSGEPSSEEADDRRRPPPQHAGSELGEFELAVGEESGAGFQVGEEEHVDVIPEEINFQFFQPDPPSDLIEVNSSERETRPYDLELENGDEHHIQGATEYSFGMWTRFRFNSISGKLIDKPDWMGLGRLTTNRNNGDLTQLGDRTLGVWIGRGYYHFATYDVNTNQVNVIQNLDYGVYLDNNWVFVYFGYKQQTESLGTVQGYLIYPSDKLVRKTDFQGVLHQPVGDYLHFTAGSASTARNEYANFNGQLTQIVFALNQGSYMDDEDLLTNVVFTKFPLPAPEEFEDHDVVIVEGKAESDRANAEVAPNEYAEEYSYQTEYSVTFWFRYLKASVVPWQSVLRLTTNEADIYGDQDHHGDRTLSIFQNINNNLHFSSYTVGDRDAVNFISDDCAIPSNAVQLWTFVYFGYSKENAKLSIYVSHPEGEYKNAIKATHYAGKYFGLYLGRDGHYFPFNGKFAYVHLHFGPASWNAPDSDHKTLTSYTDGDTHLVIHEAQDHTEFYDEKEISSETENDVNIVYEEGTEVIIDGAPEYSYGFWSRFLMTSPTRVVEKPDWIEVARLTNRPDHEDLALPGDRTLATFIGRGYYHFATYNAQGDIPNTYLNVDYADQLDGQWNFIYFGYSKSAQIATAFVVFGTDMSIQRQQFTNIDHNPFNKYVRFLMGKEFSYIGFNGRLARILLRIGPGAHISDPIGLQTILTQNTKPDFKYPLRINFNVAQDETDYTPDQPAQAFEVPEGSNEVAEYSVSGWFKFRVASDEKQPCHMVFRLTNNEDAYLQDQATLGDRTLAAFQCTDLNLATYNIGTIDNGYALNKFVGLTTGEYLGFWTYIFMGYSRFEKTVSYFVGYPDITKTGKMTGVLHFSPKYLALYVGSDGRSSGWGGKAKLVIFRIGTGSYIDGERPNAEFDYPEWFTNRLNNKVTIYSETDEEAMSSCPQPVGEDGLQAPNHDIVISADTTPEYDIEGINEYGYGLWTRWTMTYPTRLIEKADWHQVIRMATTPVYQDVAKPGNRALAVFVGKGYYHYATYDLVRELPNVYANIEYGQELEGYWNFIYFGYQRFQEGPKAVGYTYLSHLNEVRRVEIPDVKHFLLKDYVRVVVGAKEFSYLPFFGRFYDLRLFFGKGGYVATSEALLQQTLVAFRRQPPYKQVLNNVPVQEEQMEFNAGDGEPDQVDQTYDQYSGVFEYSVFGWFKFEKSFKVLPKHNVVRVTINPPEIQRDYQVAGDRALCMFVTPKYYNFATYDYGNLEINDDDTDDTDHDFDQDTNFGEWTFAYFGYSFSTKQAYAYLKYKNREDSFVFEPINHFLPNYIRVFLGNDNLYPQFEGLVKSWYLGTGPGAFTLNPQTLINTWPIDPIPDPDKILSAILNNQGINSGKLLRSGK